MTVFVTAEAVVAENTGESVWTNGTLSFFNSKVLWEKKMT